MAPLRLVLVVFAFAALVGRFEALAEPSAGNQLENEIIRQARLPAGSFGFYLVDLESKKVLAQYDAKKPFIPASVSKIPTLFMALNVLGADHRFATRLSYKGELKEGLLKGDLYLEGSGDPLLATSHFMDMAVALLKLGVKKVDGHFYFVEDALASSSVIDPLGQLDQTDNPGVGALSSEFNRFTLLRIPNNPINRGFAPIPAVPTLGVEVNNGVFEPGVRFRGRVDGDKEIWQISSKLSYDRLEDLPVRSPGRTSAELFRFLASSQGVEIPAAEKSHLPAETTLVHAHLSHPLVDIAEATLEYSNNLLAELLLLSAAKKLKGQPLSIEDSAKAMLQWYREKIPAVDWESVALRNGSGLSTQSRITPQALASVLESAEKAQFGSRYFWSLLSISGQKGWIRKRLNEPEAALKVWAKTGSMDYISSIAGYVLTARKHRLAFAILTTDWKSRELVMGPNRLLAARLRDQAGGWQAKARLFEDSLLRAWIREY